MNYADYLKWFANRQFQGYEEAPKPVSESSFDPNGMYELGVGDPLYDQALAALKAQNPDGDYRTITVSGTPGGKDRSRTVQLPDGSYAWSVDNSTQPQHDLRDALIGIGTVLGGGMLTNALMGAGFGAGSAGAGSFDFLGQMIDPAIMGSGSAADTLPAFAESPFASFGGGAGSSGFSGLGEYGGLDPETWGGAGGMSVAQNGIGPGSWFSQLQGMINNPGSALGNIGQWIIDNPGAAARIGLGGASIINALNQGNGGGGGGGGNGGGGIPWQNGTLPTFTPSMGQFQQNPYLNYQVPFMGGF